jgi:succinate dehydrogenase / fumarate reductase, cytochrome b subunit
MEAVATTKTDGAGFLRARAGSFLAIMPLGIWTVAHLWQNLAAFQGAAAWQTSVTEHAHPLAHLFTSIIVLLPLLLHTVWGITRLATVRPNIVQYSFFGNAKYILQRLSAVGLMLFLGAHLWLAMLKPRLMEGHAEAFADISHEMHHHGPTIAVYILGTLGVAYHLANGISTFAMGWGLVNGRPGLRRVELLSYGLFVLFLSMGWASIYALYTAGA